jgi:hypothetical protein
LRGGEGRKNTHVDDLEAPREKVPGVVGDMARDARDRRAVRLVDVHAAHGAAERRLRRVGVLGRAPDRVVEDEYARGACAAYS